MNWLIHIPRPMGIPNKTDEEILSECKSFLEKKYGIAFSRPMYFSVKAFVEEVKEKLKNVECVYMRKFGRLHILIVEEKEDSTSMSFSQFHFM